MTFSLSSKPTSFAPIFSTANRVSTVVTRVRSARSKFVRAFSRVPTVLPSLPAAKPRLSFARRSVPSRTNRLLTVFAKKRTTASCFTTTCRRLQPVKRVVSAARSAVKSVTVVSPSAL
ncbi:hypothetical protein EVA_09062 [gut metagenome]|uniref:Uncharacterized protein n=1 Tax=gut metagenome TaxID=749906 RepID=J9G6G6_9ZZZZ